MRLFVGFAIIFTLQLVFPAYAAYPCPEGQHVYGDGSACTGGSSPNCAIWGNKGLPRCAVVCPSGKEKYGDGSACTGGSSPNCAIWGNKNLARCVVKNTAIAEDSEPSNGKPLSSCKSKDFYCKGCSITCPIGKAALCIPGKSEFRLNKEYCTQAASCTCK